MRKLNLYCCLFLIKGDGGRGQEGSVQQALLDRALVSQSKQRERECHIRK